jgi:hypothetical protein
MGVENKIKSAIKEIKILKTERILTGAEYNALVTAIQCMEKQLSLPKKVMDLQTYKLFDGEKDTYVDRDEVLRIVR